METHGDQLDLRIYVEFSPIRRDGVASVHQKPAVLMQTSGLRFREWQNAFVSSIEIFNLSLASYGWYHLSRCELTENHEHTLVELGSVLFLLFKSIESAGIQRS